MRCVLCGRPEPTARARLCPDGRRECLLGRSKYKLRPLLCSSQARIALVQSCRSRCEIAVAPSAAFRNLKPHRVCLRARASEIEPAALSLGLEEL